MKIKQLEDNRPAGIAGQVEEFINNEEVDLQSVDYQTVKLPGGTLLFIAYVMYIEFKEG